MTQFIDAILNDDVDAVVALLRTNSDLANAEHDGSTPVQWAVEQQSGAIVKVLLDFGADSEWCEDDGETPLHIAAFNDDDVSVGYLLAAGAEVEVQTAEGKTPLMNASQAGLSTTRLLLDAGANATSQDKAGQTALHWAAVGSDSDARDDVAVEIVQALRGAGGDTTLTNALGDTAAQYARSLNRPLIAGALEG